jgi:hypothetical protein
VKINSLTSTLLVGMFVAATGCVVEMHPADSSPAPSAIQPTASSASAATPVQVVSGPSGISPPARNVQPPGTTNTMSAPTTAAKSDATGTASTGGSGAALR